MSLKRLQRLMLIREEHKGDNIVEVCEIARNKDLQLSISSTKVFFHLFRSARGYKRMCFNFSFMWEKTTALHSSEYITI